MSRSLQDRFIEPTDDRWIEFARSSPGVNIFHHHAWSRLISECYGYSSFVVVARDSEGEISAGIPIMEIDSRLRGKSWKALPFSDHCTPLYRDLGSLEQLTINLISLFEEDNIPRMELRADFSFNNRFHSTSKYVLHKLSLTNDPESVFKKVHPMHLRNIEIAKRNNVEIKIRSDPAALKEFYSLHLQTRKRLGIPVQPRDFFVSMQRKLIDKGLGFLLLAYSEGKCVSAALFLHWGNTLTYKYGASNPEGRKLKSNNLLFWEAIRWGCEKGYANFDFGKSAIASQGLREFKSRWGTDEVPLRYSSLPISPRRDSYEKLMGIMNLLIRNTPTWVGRIVGEALYRHFG